ncbi:hypothetical protein N658DRAFT_158186 [Parathielavia hyrcaniae]|uniref:Uncharacterized protein n=1 Tax=Parathielavia hyrcaniae TaxID=113614 RepID=A0AAN6T0E8_9PEZI|nr:hypothetical protein N658DRAFT_158186 [Parathielavia hyrcaniae]
MAVSSFVPRWNVGSRLDRDATLSQYLTYLIVWNVNVIQRDGNCTISHQQLPAAWKGNVGREKRKREKNCARQPAARKWRQIPGLDAPCRMCGCVQCAEFVPVVWVHPRSSPSAMTKACYIFLSDPQNKCLPEIRDVAPSTIACIRLMPHLPLRSDLCDAAKGEGEGDPTNLLFWI